VSELHDLAAAALAERVRRREVSATEVVRAALARIEATEPRVQAWERLDAEGALAAAAAVDAAVGRGAAGPLAGVPIGVKAIYDVAGLPTTAGWHILPDTPAAADAESVRRLRQAGAIILGKTISTPFAMVDPPRTRNPWDPTRTPGGSSSGSAAAVAARQVPATLGTQTAGSILRPAGYCGAVGFKPTFGRISRRGIFPLAWSLDHAGLITRTVEDAALLLSVLAGHDPADPGSRDRPADDYRAAVAAPAPPRLGLVRDLVDRAEPAVRGHVLDAARALAQAGAQVDEVVLPAPFELMLAAHHVVLQCEAAAVHAALYARHQTAYPPRVRAAVEVGQLLPASAYLRAQQWRRRIRQAAAALLADRDCLLMPTAANLPPDPSTTGDTRFQAIWSGIGFPALSLPSGLSTERLPFSLQLVAAPWREATLLAAARWCELQLGPLPAPC
jgi:aspartyl-tRNA(Asn)/glutamyl-tRNA(Gln) amidotransferase subunit A